MELRQEISLVKDNGFKVFEAIRKALANRRANQQTKRQEQQALLEAHAQLHQTMAGVFDSFPHLIQHTKKGLFLYLPDGEGGLITIRRGTDENNTHRLYWHSHDYDSAQNAGQAVKLDTSQHQARLIGREVADPDQLDWDANNTYPADRLLLLGEAQEWIARLPQ